MITWVDRTIYERSERDTVRTPRLWCANIGKLTLNVMRHSIYPGTWVAQCAPFFDGFSPRDLETDDIDEAKRVAVDMLYTELRVAMEVLDAAYPNATPPALGGSGDTERER